MNMVVIYLGIDSIRFLLNIKAPLLIALGLALLAWAYVQARRVRADAGAALAVRLRAAARPAQFWAFFFPALTAMIGFWATLSLNIPDFTRYARSQRDQVLGQALGLPTTMALYSFIGVAVTSATVDDLRQGDLGPGRRALAVPQPAGAVGGDGLALPGDPGDQHRGQRGQPGERLRPPLAAADLVPDRRPDHRRRRHPDPALEADRRPVGLHLQVAGRLLVAARARWAAS